MPYIRPVIREELKLPDNQPMNPGELNYVITVICKAYIEARGRTYSVLNEVCGVLTCAQQELYRRVVAPYEDEKITENGDVW